MEKVEGKKMMGEIDRRPIVRREALNYKLH